MIHSTLRSACVALALTAIVPDACPIKVHTLGDSTMADYDPSATVTRGWGMYVSQFLTGGATAVNYARGGRDSRQGYTELWTKMAKPAVEAGDYVIIQFAHNDEKNNGMDGVALYNYYDGIGYEVSASAVDQRGTVPATTYKEYLGLIATEALNLGAHPIFVAPVCRSYFTDGVIRRNGRHDLGDSYKVLTADGPADGTPLTADDHTMDYAYQMKVLAEEMYLPFIDPTTATRDLYESYGPAKCEPMLFDGAGSTHFNSTGATLAARLCMQLLREQGILTDYISLTTDLCVSPAQADLGEVYKGQILIKEFTLSGFDMEPADGSIRIEPPAGIGIVRRRLSDGRVETLKIRK